jgi:hypothetical protein
MIRLTELTFGWQVTVLTDGQAGQQVSEVGAEHIGLYDPATDTHSRLPRYLIRMGAPREQQGGAPQVA